MSYFFCNWDPSTTKHSLDVGARMMVYETGQMGSINNVSKDL